MGHHTCQIPDLEILIKQYNTLGLEGFVARYKKCECMIGDSNAIQYIEQMCKLVKEITNK